MTTYNTFKQAVSTALKANGKVGQALAAFQPEYDAADPAQQYAWRLDIAGVIAKAYSVEVSERVYQGAKAIGFKGEAAEAARSAMRYYFPAKTDSAGQSMRKEAAQGDDVAALFKRFAKLSKTEQAKFLKLIAAAK